jgi:hypothetical protein
MARTRSVVLELEVCVSKKANNTCAHDRKNHPVPRGDTWLKVTQAGAMGSTKGYCVPCAQRILLEAKATIDARLAEINAAAGHSTDLKE